VAAPLLASVLFSDVLFSAHALTPPTHTRAQVWLQLLRPAANPSEPDSDGAAPPGGADGRPEAPAGTGPGPAAGAGRASRPGGVGGVGGGQAVRVVLRRGRDGGEGMAGPVLL
jgi:hypothetical protein